MKKKVLLITILIGVLSLSIIFKKEDNKLIKDNIKNDNKKIAVNISEDGINYTDINEIPTTGYSLNTEKSMCKVATNSIASAPKDNNITIEYTDGKINFLGVTKQSTRCYLYFDKKDEEKPVITNVTTSVTKTEINVTVTATDNEGVTEYWYQIDSQAAVKQTTNTYKFTGLTAGTTYSVKVYVKDATGNQSDTTTKSVTTTPNTASETILANITPKTETPDFSKTATTDEGVYAVSDGMYGGTSYYWRGAVTNNYVKFANFCWRIVRINGDKTIRLIYDGATCHANRTKTEDSIAKINVQYNTFSDQSNYVGWTYSGTSQRTTSGTASNAKSELESWYSGAIIGTNVTKVADGKYCNDRNVQIGKTWSINGSTFYYAAYNRINIGAPTLSCPNGDVYTLNVGLITVDEVMHAGGKFENNSAYYLYNGHAYWTMSPNYWGSGGPASMFFVESSGQIIWTSTNGYSANYAAPGLRPVINLKSNVTFSGGNGTQSNPYIVS